MRHTLTLSDSARATADQVQLKVAEMNGLLDQAKELRRYRYM